MLIEGYGQMVKNTKTSVSSFIIFSIILFLIILVVGSFGYMLSMQKIIKTNKGNEMTQMLETEEMRLESSLNAEIAIVAIGAIPLLDWYYIATMTYSIEDYVSVMIAQFLAVLVLLMIIFIIFNVFVAKSLKSLRKASENPALETGGDGGDGGDGGAGGDGGDGGDGNLTKPNKLPLFLTRAKALMRRAYTVPDRVEVPDGFFADFAKRVLTLTLIEKKILKSYINGTSDKEITSALYITNETLREHCERIYYKLGASGREELMFYIRLLKMSGQDCLKWE